MAPVHVSQCAPRSSLAVSTISSAALTLEADELQLGPKKKSKKKAARPELDLDALLADNGRGAAGAPATEPIAAEKPKAREQKKEAAAVPDAELDALLAEIDAPAPPAPNPAAAGGVKKKKKGELTLPDRGNVPSPVTSCGCAVMGGDRTACLVERNA